MRQRTAATIAALIIEAPLTRSDPFGHWINPKHSVTVEITECAGNAICGRVTWASSDAIGDARNAGTAPLVGTELFHGLVLVRPGRWRGRIYVPDKRKTHVAELELLDGARLEIRGCLAGRLICKSQVWTRIERPTP